MQPPKYVERELRLISPRYFAYFHNRRKRWEIRKWRSLSRQRHPLLNSNILKTIRLEDGGGNDIGYKDIEGNVCDIVRRELWNARNAWLLMKQVDASNAKLVEDLDKEETYAHRQAAKDIYRHYQEPRVFL